MRASHRPLERVLVVLASADRRGAEVQGEALARSLAARGFAAEAVAVSPARGGAALDVEVLGGSWRSLRTLWQLRRRMRGALVVAHGSTALPAVFVASLAQPTTWWYRSIGDPAAWVRGSLHRFRTSLLMRRAGRVVTLWEGAGATVCALYGIDPDGVDVIPNSRDPGDFPPADTDRRAHVRGMLGVDGPTVVFCGALSEEKRPLDAVEVIRGLDDVTLLVVGDGPLSGRVREAASSLPAGRVRLLGPVADVRLVLDAADALLVTSRTEGMPGVVIEALFCGLPVVATDVGAVRSMLEGVPTARCCPPGDVAALRRAVAEVAVDGGVSERTADPRALERFDQQRVIDEWVGLLDRAGVVRAVPGRAN